MLRLRRKSPRRHSAQPFSSSWKIPDVDFVRYSGTIPSGLARRVASEVDGSVQKLTTPDLPVLSQKPSTKVEIRILDFSIVH